MVLMSPKSKMLLERIKTRHEKILGLKKLIGMLERHELVEMKPSTTTSSQKKNPPK
ncbi:MAG: hypothetical protein A4E61_00160 [Syntrophorhabdus sp. PtaB.Bin184]|nr:MAG: hypothetical protein A4E61_00160 [Syntrophorhabdus sp. PtaB.Bin184]